MILESVPTFDKFYRISYELTKVMDTVGENDASSLVLVQELLARSPEARK